MRRGDRSSNGTTLLATIITMAVLAFGAAHVSRLTASRYRGLCQADAWHEALASAEADAEIALVALSSGNWTGWSATKVGGATLTADELAKALPDLNAAIVRKYTMPALKHAGDGNTSQLATLVVDSPTAFTTSRGKFFRIRATGSASVAGGGHVGFDAYDTALRKLSLVQDRETGKKVTSPRVSRTIEVIARSAPTYRRPLVLLGKFNPKQSTSLIDSYDSDDPLKSTNGLYDAAKRQSNGNIIINDSTGTDLSGISIYGTLGYTGPTIPNAQNVKGKITTPQTEKVLPVLKPTWTSVDANLGAVTAGGTVVAGPVGTPTRYKMSSVKIGSGADVVFAEPVPGQGGEVEVWVTGDLNLAGSARLIIPKGVTVTVWFEGNMKAAGSVATNYNGAASSLSFNGVTPTDGTARTVSMGGGSTTIAAFNVPAYDVAIDGGGTFFGGFIAKTLSFNNGKGEVHYDEALSRRGGIGSEFTVVSFAEDVR